MIRGFLAIALMGLFAGLSPEASVAAGADIRVETPWARASIGTSRPGVAYLTLVNPGERDVTVTGAETPVAGRVAFHRTVRKGEIMHMEPVKAIDVPAGKMLTLQPGGMHIMLMDLNRVLERGGRFPLTLRLSDGRLLSTIVPIMGPGASGPGERYE